MKSTQMNKIKQGIKLCILLILVFSTYSTYAQTGLNFQGVARNNNNVILASQQISLRLTILQGSAAGSTEYSETRNVITNAQGLFNVVIGDTGAITTLGSFSTINWKANPKFLKIEMDVAAGNNFITMGTTQFQSVAFAQFANSVEAENITGIVPVARGGTGTNSLNSLKTALALDKSSVGLVNVENTALSAWPGSNKITNVGNITSGTWKSDAIAVENGGTGGTNSSEARRNLGLEIGVHVQGPLTPDYDYLTPTGSAIHLTNFPILNQSTTGNAASATLAEKANLANNINATSNTTINSLPYLSETGIITTGTWSGSVIAIEKGGTGSTNASNARINLGLVIGTDVQAPLAVGEDYLAPTGSASGLRDFPILNQNTTGNAATANNVTGIVAIENGGTNSTAIPTAGGIGFGNGIAHAYTSAGIIGQILSSNGVGDPRWVTPNTISVPYTGATSAVDLGAFDLKVNNLTIGVGAGNNPRNTVFGAYALNSNTIGYKNVAVGFSALFKNIGGGNNVAFGGSALYNNTDGNYNTANGNSALYNNTTGSSNTANGNSALNSNTTGNANTASGLYALNYNTTGDYNVANGANSLFNNSTGINNVAIGNNSLFTNTTGSSNTMLGSDADVIVDGLTNATAIGANAKVATSNTIQLGDASITSVLTSGTMSAANYTGTWNGNIIDIAHGGTGTNTANFVDLTSNQNNISGAKTFLADANINGLTIGKGAGTLIASTAIGMNALSMNTTGDNNTALGRYVLMGNISGSYNTSIGNNALSTNTSGSNNTGIGTHTLNLNTIGFGNTAIGSTAMQSNTTGAHNTAVGQSSLITNTTGTDNTAIGSGADVSVGNLTNATAIGAGAIVNTSNTIQLGNTSVRSVVTIGKVFATGFVISTGTGSQFLKANGSVDESNYVNKDATTIAIGTDAGNTNQNEFAIAIGTDAGATSQGIASIGIGMHAGETGQRNNAIGIGTSAGFTNQGYNAIGIGENAAKTNQNEFAIAIGTNAGNERQGYYSIGIGGNAAKLDQGGGAVAIGYAAGNEAQGVHAISLGYAAGNLDQSINSIAIGSSAGNSSQGANSIAIGAYAGFENQGSNSIILNATGNTLNTSTTGLFVDPIRLSTPKSPVYYDLATKEITYGTTIDAGTLTGTTAVVNGGTGLTSPGTTGNVLTSNGTDWISAPISSSVDLTTAQTVSGSKSFSSNMRVGTATATSSAVLEVSSTTQGFLPPRMTLDQRDAILSPATGLMIFCTNCTPKGDPEYYNGTRWTSMLSAAPLANTIIGDQVWSSTNLNVGKYRNGDVIPQVTGTAWAGLTTGAWCWYNDDSVTYAATYGKLYNWHAVNDPRGLAPLGWHIPTIAEWTILTDYLGGTTIAGGAMKQTGTSLWTTPNTGATNTSGFVALPGGVRNASNFDEISNFGHWWSASAYGTGHAWAPYMYFSTANSYINYLVKNNGLSVRCVRD